MDALIPLASALAPAILLVLYATYRDRRNPEPLGKIVRGIFYGLLSVLLTLIIVPLMGEVLQMAGLSWVYGVPVLSGAFMAFYDAAIPEETAKLLMLWLLLRRNREYEEHMDGIVYAVCVGMGFAGLENVLYVIQSEGEWVSTAIVRALLSVPGHYIFAVLMGFFYSLVHFQPQRFGKYRLCVWLFPVLAHGIYDAICMVGDDLKLSGLAMIPLIWFCIKMHKFCFKRIRSLELQDQDQRDLDTFTRAMEEEKR